MNEVQKSGICAMSDVRETKHCHRILGLRSCSGGNFLYRCLCRGVGLQDPQSSRAPYVQRSAPIGEKPGKLPAKPQNGVPMGSWVGTGKVLDRFLLDVRGYSLEALMILLFGSCFFLHLAGCHRCHSFGSERVCMGNSESCRRTLTDSEWLTKMLRLNLSLVSEQGGMSTSDAVMLTRQNLPFEWLALLEKSSLQRPRQDAKEMLGIVI